MPTRGLVAQLLAALVAGGIYLWLSGYAFTNNPFSLKIASLFQDCSHFDSEIECRIAIQSAMVLEDLLVVLILCIFAAIAVRFTLRAIRVPGSPALLATGFVAPLAIIYIVFSSSPLIVGAAMALGAQWFSFYYSFKLVALLTR